MKKVLVLIIFAVLMTGCFAEKEVLISKDSGLVGIWTMTDPKENEKEGYIVDKITFQFYEDGSCIYAFCLLVGTEMDLPLEGKTEGNCYLNKDNNRFKMKSEKQNMLFDKWNNFKLNGSTLIIGNYTFNKVN